jgi:CheY-like chemotaxis protein
MAHYPGSLPGTLTEKTQDRAYHYWKRGFHFFRKALHAAREPFWIAVGRFQGGCAPEREHFGRSRVKESMPGNAAKPRVLVADDEPVIADTLAMILNQSGFEARAVYSGERALELAATFAPEMLISDVIMADLNGIDAAIRIQALLPGIKILLFSGQAATADLLEKARARGYEFEILAKPVHPQDLLKKLRG